MGGVQCGSGTIAATLNSVSLRKFAAKMSARVRHLFGCSGFLQIETAFDAQNSQSIPAQPDRLSWGCWGQDFCSCEFPHVEHLISENSCTCGFLKALIPSVVMGHTQYRAERCVLHSNFPVQAPAQV